MAAAPDVRPEQLSRFPAPPSGGRPGAVLALFGEGPDGPDLLFIERAGTLREHAGQPAFPGGGLDPGEDAVAAALREAEEEVGLDPASVEVFGVLPELYVPPSGFRVATVLGWWRDPHAVAPVDAGEVAAVERIPIAALADPANRCEVGLRGGFTGPAFQVGELLIWGFTGGLTAKLLEIGGWARPWGPGPVLPRPGISYAPPMDKAQEIVDALSAGLAPLERDVFEAWWRSNTESSPENDARRVELEQALSDRYADPQVYAMLRDLPAPPGDPVTARCVEVLRLAYEAEQLPAEQRAEMVRLSAECDSIYASFRGEAGGRRWSDNDVEKTLAASDDSDERRAAWEASKQVGAEVRDRVMRLVEVRNECARMLGHPNWYSMSLALGELDETKLFALLGELDRLTAEPFARMKADLDERLSARFGVPVGELMPWHYADPFFQEAPRETAVDLDPLVAGIDVEEATVRTYRSIGIELGEVLARSDLYTREGKSQHAFCVNVDRGRDIRVLCNVIPNERWVSTMLHEFGHAAYDAGVSLDLPWALRGPAHSLTTEAVAQLFGRLSKDAGWLRDVAGVEAPEDDLRKALRAHMLVFARWVLVMCSFERDLYADPAGDHDARWWSYVERFQGLRTPPGRRAPDWAAKLHLALAPVYYQNYVLGECLASQLSATVRARGGRLYDDPETGRWLVDEVFAPGASLRWDRLVERATGSPLSAEAFVAEFVRQ